MKEKEENQNENNTKCRYRDRLGLFKKFYLVELCGDILLVVRFIGKFVDWDEKLVCEAADCTHPKSNYRSKD
ncbi:hypothetical protein QQP08_020259 [Theobroma cacao]|nr:hypothetical protein QQP08_020259 [Theobroma cacao]